MNRWHVCALGLIAAAGAAVLAHISIDIAGDYWLAHDAYDDVAHGSRTLISVVALAVAAGAGFRLLLAAIGARRSADLTHVRFNAVPVRWIPFIACVVAATFVLLAGMERIDLLLAGAGVDDLDDLFGGSLLFGAAFTLPIAIVVALAVGGGARWIAAAGDAVVQLIAQRYIQRRARDASALALQRGPRHAFAPSPCRARSASKRGPPMLLR